LPNDITSTADVYASAGRAAVQTLSNCLALPFDIARERYARAVRAGLIERSLLASARFGTELTAWERIALGPWARRP
jgi:hypothetical protein